MELHWFAVILVGLVWAGLLVPRVPLSLAGFAVLITGTLFGPYFFAIDGPFAISLDRILWLLMLVLFVGSWLTGRTSASFSMQRQDWLLLTFVLYLLASTQFGAPPPDDVPLARWIFYICMPFGIYVVARFSDVTQRNLRVIHNGLIVFGVYLALTAVAEKVGLTAAVFPRFIADPSTIEFFGRARGPLLNPSGNGFLLTITTCAIIVRWHDSNRLGKAAYGLLACLSLVGVYATMTRSVWLSVVLAIGLLQLKRTRRSIRIWCLAAGTCAAAVLVTGFGDEILYLKRDKHLSAQASAESIELRPLLAVLAMEVVKDRPIFGVGYGHYFAYNSHYAQSASHELPVRKAIPYMQHNVILSMLTDTGLIGATLFTVLLLYWGLQAWRITHSTSFSTESRTAGAMLLAATAGYITNGMFQDVSVIPMVNMYLFYFAGLAGAVEAAAATQTQRILPPQTQALQQSPRMPSQI